MINTLAASILWCLLLCFWSYCSISNYPEVCVQSKLLQQGFMGMVVLALLFVNYFLISSKPFLSLFLLHSWATSGKNKSLGDFQLFFPICFLIHRKSKCEIKETKISILSQILRHCKSIKFPKDIFSLLHFPYCPFKGNSFSLLIYHFIAVNGISGR